MAFVCSQSRTATLTLCRVRRRPKVQPYVMASGVTKPGTTNGHPLKAQLQIVGESALKQVCFLYFPAAACCFGCCLLTCITNFSFFFVHMWIIFFISIFCFILFTPHRPLCVSLLQCYQPSWKKTRRTGLVPVPTWKWRWTASRRRPRNAATPTAPNGSSHSLCESEFCPLSPLLSFPGCPYYDFNLLASRICSELIKLTHMLESSVSHNSPSHAHPVAHNLLVVTPDFVLGLWTLLNRSVGACLFLLQLIIGDELFTEQTVLCVCAFKCFTLKKIKCLPPQKIPK